MHLVADYWLRAAALRASIYVDRVESDSNISDDPSRMNVENVMKFHNADYRPPSLESFTSRGADCTDSPLTWFGGEEQWKRMIRFVESARSALASGDSSSLFTRPTNTHPAWSEGITLLS